MFLAYLISATPESVGRASLCDAAGATASPSLRFSLVLRAPSDPGCAPFASHLQSRKRYPGGYLEPLIVEPPAQLADALKQDGILEHA